MVSRKWRYLRIREINDDFDYMFLTELDMKETCINPWNRAALFPWSSPGLCNLTNRVQAS